jgi:chromosome segregation ATPase
MATVAALQQDLEAAIERLQALNAGMQQARTQYQNLGTRIQEARESFDTALQNATEGVLARTKEVAERLEQTAGTLSQLVELVDTTTDALQASHQPVADALNQHTESLAASEETLQQANGQFIADEQAFLAAAQTRVQTIAADDQIAAEQYRDAVGAAMAALGEELAKLSQAQAAALAAHVQVLHTKDLQPTTQHLDQVAQQLAQAFANSRSKVDQTLVASMQDFAERNRSQRANLAQNTSTLLSSLSELGGKLGGLTTTLVDGSQNVQSLMNTSTLGLRAAIEAFDSVQRLMDEILNA